MTTVPAVTLLSVDEGTEPAFRRTGDVPVGGYPYLLDADNLRDAAVLASRCDDEDGLAPIPILRIDTTRQAAIEPVPESARPTEIAFPASARLLAGLIADAVRVGVATGALIRTEDRAGNGRLLDDVAEHLRRAGFVVGFEVEGWRLYDQALVRAS
ncbi:hypothetical protein [Nocardia bhagyanarayanae]|uniref:Uncharacterized protein n=1 Tax=Nocardia bhagyanarayanae TaxID=1215925 RepID=A0A543FFD5_9NOCA|nr:hypothetical protein [Nocardia bhagyanarayanae]TQM32578.1 hypothetical protein FB390_4269 [Nocardia bhagyanarayanae]